MRIYFKYNMSHDCIHTIIFILEPLIVCKEIFVNRADSFLFGHFGEKRSKSNFKFIQLSSRPLSPFLYLSVECFMIMCLVRSQCIIIFEMDAIIQCPKMVLSFQIEKKKHRILSIFIDFLGCRITNGFKCNCQYVTCLLHEFLFVFLFSDQIQLISQFKSMRIKSNTCK